MEYIPGVIYKLILLRSGTKHLGKDRVIKPAVRLAVRQEWRLQGRHKVILDPWNT